jgi:hypothetical protein
MIVRILLMLSSFAIIPTTVAASNYDGTYRKPLLMDDESGYVEFITISKTTVKFDLHSQRRGFSCTTEGFDDNAVASLNGSDANYRHKDGCEIAFRFDSKSVYIIANDSCDKWCGEHAYGSFTGLYHKVTNEKHAR